MNGFKITSEYVTVNTQAAGEYYDITDNLQAIISDKKIQRGLLMAYSMHTTTGLVVNEGSDPGVGKDVSEILWNLIPEDRNWNHTEESPLDSAAHVKAQIIGNSLFLGIENNKLVLGTWQRVYFIEYIEERERKVYVIILGE